MDKRDGREETEENKINSEEENPAFYKTSANQRYMRLTKTIIINQP